MNTQAYQKIVSDGGGGAIITWQDLRGGVAYDIYAQYALAAGALDPVWPANGRALCTAGNEQANLNIVSDGVGGAIVTMIAATTCATIQRPWHLSDTAIPALWTPLSLLGSSGSFRASRCSHPIRAVCAEPAIGIPP